MKWYRFCSVLQSHANTIQTVWTVGRLRVVFPGPCVCVSVCVEQTNSDETNCYPPNLLYSFLSDFSPLQMFVGAGFCLLLHFISICFARHNPTCIWHMCQNFRSNGTSFRCNWIFTFENLGARCAFCNILLVIIELMGYSSGNPAHTDCLFKFPFSPVEKQNLPPIFVLSHFFCW